MTTQSDSDRPLIFALSHNPAFDAPPDPRSQRLFSDGATSQGNPDVPTAKAPIAFDEITAKDFIGAWRFDEFEHIVTADLTWVSRKLTGHMGWFGKFAYFPDLDGRPYVITETGGVYPQFIYGAGYTGGSTQGATRIEYPKKTAMPVLEFYKDRHVLEIGGKPIVYQRAAHIAEPLLAARYEDLKMMLAAEEAKYASDCATFNNGMNMGFDIQRERWKLINRGG